MFGIYSNVYERLIHYFKTHSEIIEVVLFGSRAKANYTQRSDIDLCILIHGGSKAAITFDIEEIVGIYSCDILFADQIAGEIKHQVERDGIVIYTKV